MRSMRSIRSMHFMRSLGHPISVMEVMHRAGFNPGFSYHVLSAVEHILLTTVCRISAALLLLSLMSSSCFGWHMWVPGLV